MLCFLYWVTFCFLCDLDLCANVVGNVIGCFFLWLSNSCWTPKNSTSFITTLSISPLVIAIPADTFCLPLICQAPPCPLIPTSALDYHVDSPFVTDVAWLNSSAVELGMMDTLHPPFLPHQTPTVTLPHCLLVPLVNIVSYDLWATLWALHSVAPNDELNEFGFSFQFDNCICNPMLLSWWTLWKFPPLAFFWLCLPSPFGWYLVLEVAG